MTKSRPSHGSPSESLIYAQQIRRILTSTDSPKCFKKIQISALALVKMTMHAKSGGNIEIMGLMTGKIDGDTMFVIDSFALPVEGTEVRLYRFAIVSLFRSHTHLYICRLV